MLACADVANAVGPFAGIFFVYQNRRMSSNAPTPTWILVLGAAGIVVGLGTYGYNIIKVLGVKMATMTPSRGFCAELGTALTISIASVYGLPISTTQCIVSLTRQARRKQRQQPPLGLLCESCSACHQRRSVACGFHVPCRWALRWVSVWWTTCATAATGACLA